MPPPNEEVVLDQGSKIFLIVWAIGVVTIWPPWFWFSIRSRRVRGEPVMPRPPAPADFCERSASGRAAGNIFGHAHNCLMVSVAGDEVWITPVFPFNLIAPYGVMGLEYRVPKSRITHAEFRKGWRSAVLLDLSPHDGGRPRRVELYLKHPDAFLRTLGRSG